MAIYGYCRVSTPKQNIERQIRNIKAAYPDILILQDEYTGTKMDRPSWMKIYRKAEDGDIIIFDSVSRMSRNAEDGFAVYEELYHRGVLLVFLKEPQVNSETYRHALDSSVPMTGTNVDYILAGVNQYLMALAKEQIRLAFGQAEKEVTDLRQRTREGIQTARINGKQIGQRRGGGEAQREESCRDEADHPSTCQRFRREPVGCGGHEVGGSGTEYLLPL